MKINIISLAAGILSTVAVGALFAPLLVKA